MVRFIDRIVNRICCIYNMSLFLKFGTGSFIARPYLSIEGREYISIGKRCYIGKNARIEAFNIYNKKKFSPRIIIGSDVCINQNFHCTCASSVYIGNGTSITANCGVFDIIHPYFDIEINPRNADIDVNPVSIGENCLIGMNSVLLPGTKLGKHCVVGANSTLSKEYPSYTVVVGSPAKIVKRYCFETNTWRKTDSLGNFID